MTIQFQNNQIITDTDDANHLIIKAVGYFICENHFYQREQIQDFVRENWSEQFLSQRVKDLSGCFQIIVVDKQKQELVVIQDRWGTYPLFYTQNSNGIIVSDDHRKLLNSDSSYDSKALVEFIGLGHVLGDKTLIKGIREFKPHHVARIQVHNQKPTITEESYWQYRLSFGKADFKQSSKAFAQLWQERSKILFDGIKSIGSNCYIPLSAGLDSRLLAASAETHGLTQSNLTFGCGLDNIEIETALKVSRCLSNSLGHYILNINHAGYRQLINEAPHSFRITTAYFGEKDLWYPGKFKTEIAAFIPGHSGDFMAGSHLKSKMKLWKCKEDVARYIVFFKSTPLCKHLYQNDAEYREQIMDSLMSTLDDSDGLINAFIRWDLEERQRRYIIRSVISEQHEQLPLVVLPYFDYELMDFFTDLPFKFLRNTELYRHASARHILNNQTALSKIPINGEAIIPKASGLVKEYMTKLSHYFNLIDNFFVFDDTINWDEFIESKNLPNIMLDKQWFNRDFFKTNSRFYYALSQFHIDFNQSTKSI
ncbi:MAG: hypothetical protein N4A74_22100 [Carboxylicivirga sp.]|nr:hypothetical protein [Carboxylicivirga sp.]